VEGADGLGGPGAMLWAGMRLSQSVALGWYTAFLQNAGGVVVVYPERCSGLVCGVPLGHGRR
jgi:hypothetical protein